MYLACLLWPLLKAFENALHSLGFCIRLFIKPHPVLRLAAESIVIHSTASVQFAFRLNRVEQAFKFMLHFVLLSSRSHCIRSVALALGLVDFVKSELLAILVNTPV